MTKKFRFGKRSRSNLADVHPDLVKVAKRALELSSIDFVITDGSRTLEEQKHYLAIGASKTLKSRHLDGCAIDFAAIVNNKITWAWPAMTVIAECFKQAGKELGISVQWGGDWPRFKDGPHIQLNPRKYRRWK